MFPYSQYACSSDHSLQNKFKYSANLKLLAKTQSVIHEGYSYSNTHTARAAAV